MHGTFGDAGRWLVFGLSGQVGDAVARRLREHPREGDPPVVAVSRAPRPDAGDGRVTWCAGALPAFAAPDGPWLAIVSLGPLDQFAAWFESSPLAPARVVALGSTSLRTKTSSRDEEERAIAVRLGHAETRLAAAAAARGSALTLLRPTLVYGNGRDRSLSRVVALARRWPWLPVPAGARGLRQPVHVDDIAQAVLQALRAPGPVPGAFDLPGGERLAFDEMLRRCLAAGAPRCRPVPVPRALFRLGLGLLRAGGRAPGAGFVDRLDQDQVGDPGPAIQALGFHPRPFRPGPEAFPR